MEKLISIVGLTSSGKSDLAIKLATMFDGEIVSADSRQVYGGLDWCSGKVSKEEQKLVKHHLIDVAKLGETFTLYDFQKMAYSAIDGIIEKGKIPFLVGGTGLYSRAIVEGYNLTKAQPNFELRENLSKLSKDELENICKEMGIEVPEETTIRRLVRMIENEGSAKSENRPKYDVLQIGIFWERSEIYERIEKRLKARMPFMIQEIKDLIASGESVEFLKTLGLEAKYVSMYVLGEFASYDEFFEKLLMEERHFAKRQNTWYNKEKNIVWLDAKENLLENAKNLVEKFLKK